MRNRHTVLYVSQYPTWCDVDIECKGEKDIRDIRCVHVVCVCVCLLPPGCQTVWRRTAASCRASPTGSDWLRLVLTKLKAVKKPPRYGSASTQHYVMHMWLLIHNMLNIIMSIVVWFQYDDFSFVCVQVFSSAKYPAPDHLQDYSSIFIEATDPSSQTRPRHRIQNKLRPFDDKSLQVRWTHHSCNRVRGFLFFFNLKWIQSNESEKQDMFRLSALKLMS